MTDLKKTFNGQLREESKEDSLVGCLHALLVEKTEKRTEGSGGRISYV